MFVNIRSSVFEDHTNYDALDYILGLFVSKKHFWIINDYDSIKNSDWYKNEQGRIKQNIDSLVEKFIVEKTKKGTSTYKNKIKFIISSEPKLENEYILIKAKPILDLPLHIILENPTYDGYFIQSIVNAFKNMKLRDAYKKNWIVNDGDGGTGGLENATERLLGMKQIPTRIFVLRDSDRRFPKGVNETVKQLESYLTEKKIKYHILKKRETENYIPISTLDNYSNIDKQILEEYKKLTDEQKDFFDLNDGFSKNLKTSEEKDFFNNLSSKNQTYKLLRKGFGKTSIQPIFSNCNISKDEYISRCHNNPKELEEIINKITELL
ncbi:MAG: hypothetical protein GY936_07275 [Ignavibacteriae bacterium]|nr:hypothetical protein [Ignavibacteriota bacterium]